MDPTRLRLHDLPPDLRALVLTCFRTKLPSKVGEFEISFAEPFSEDGLPAYLLLTYAETELVVHGAAGRDELVEGFEGALRRGVLFEMAPDVARVALILDAWDSLFRESHLFTGNIYLGSDSALAELVEITAPGPVINPQSLLAELQALEIIYQFPVAYRFRGAYDGVTQFRLNGWGRRLAHRLRENDLGSVEYSAVKSALESHLQRHEPAYRSHMEQLLSNDGVVASVWESAMALPVAVLT
jgi:hypothetical protein